MIVSVSAAKNTIILGDDDEDAINEVSPAMLPLTSG